MNPLIYFQNLKNDVLLAYKNQYPYFEGNWKSFSSNDILNLIDLIEKNVKQKVSEKWIYTHLKPESNEKLPRKDMLDILSKLVGYSSWDEYTFKQKEVVLKTNEFKNSKKKLVWPLIGIGFVFILGMTCYYFFFYENDHIHSLKVNDSYTQDQINTEEINAVIVKDSKEIPVEIINSELQIKTDDSANVIIKSPFYKEKTIVVKNEHPHPNITLQPNDYAMMLKAFMKSDIKDWQTRKTQLNKILSDDLEVMVMLKNNIGAEYLNKEEFSEKLIIPSQALQKMKIIDIQSNENEQIKFIRIIQE
jgi:hypothetical protein